MNTFSTLNELWASLMVEELVRNEITYFCISPGSRSTSLTLAVARNKKATSIIHADERGMAFHGLGYASAKKEGVALITTSGSAVANVFPAVVEASKKKIPLVVLTADRPAELQWTGANQTIDQVRIFGDYVRWSYEIPCPTEDIDPAYVLTTVDQAVHRSRAELPGPVHLNCQYREPFVEKKKRNFAKYLSPINKWSVSTKPYTQYERSTLTISSKQLSSLTLLLQGSSSGIIAVGKVSSQDKKYILALAEKLQWPLFVDSTSGLRSTQHPLIINHFDLLLTSHQPKVQTVLQLGGRLTSKRWEEFIGQFSLKNFIVVLPHPLRNDPHHKVTMRVQGSLGDVCKKLSTSLKRKPLSTGVKRLQNINKKIHIILDNHLTDFNEPSIARKVSQIIGKNQVLFLSSSLPIREYDTFADMTAKSPLIGANRGASGIDGIIASAAGFAQGQEKLTTVLIGDLAAFYDLNSVAFLKKITVPVVVIVINNKGGGIFNFLPISSQKEFTTFFSAEEHISFAHAAATFGLPYKQVHSLEELHKQHVAAQQKKESTIIEVITDKKETVQTYQKVFKHIKKTIQR